MNKLINPIALVFMAGALAYIGPALEQPTTATQDGIKATRADMHTNAAKQRACGPNASWHDVDETTIQCVNKKNKPTIKASL